MAKRVREYVKYSTKELDLYAKREGSCVHKINTNMHMSIGPYCLADFKNILKAHILRTKIGYYDAHLDGIILDIKNVKIFGSLADMRADDYHLHFNYNADVYIFKPEIGAVLTGVVKHIGVKHLGVILYRVFNANLKFPYKLAKDDIQMKQEVKFRVINYKLHRACPYIEGELLTADGKKMEMGKRYEHTEELGLLINLIKEELVSDEEKNPETSSVAKKKVEKKKVPKDSSQIPKKTRAKKVKATISMPMTSIPIHNLQFESIIQPSSDDIRKEQMLNCTDAKELCLLNSRKETETEKSFKSYEHSIRSSSKVKNRKQKTDILVNGIQAILEPDLSEKTNHIETLLPPTPKKIKEEDLDNCFDPEMILVKTEAMDYSTDGTCSTTRKRKKQKSTKETLNSSTDGANNSTVQRTDENKRSAYKSDVDDANVKEELED
uniref:RPA43 OB domain-containing protein n=1 Tax=Glossina brevipalpis TaxID=37001 RepID=A0A1A9WXD5_9MUSC